MVKLNPSVYNEQVKVPGIYAESNALGIYKMSKSRCFE